VVAPHPSGVEERPVDGRDATFDLDETPPRLPASPPPSLEEIIRAAWPGQENQALRIARCESDVGRHPDTYDLTKPNAGPMQLNRSIWEPFFLAKYGWPWELVVNDPVVHVAAAREVFDRSSGWSPWRCSPA